MALRSAPHLRSQQPEITLKSHGRENVAGTWTSWASRNGVWTQTGVGALLGFSRTSCWSGHQRSILLRKGSTQKKSADVPRTTFPAIYYLYCLSFLGHTLALPLGPALMSRGLDVGTFTSSFFLGQLLGGVALPIPSERVGITPVLVASLLAAAAAWCYVGYALQHHIRLQWFLLARGVAGFGSGIIAVLKTYLARILPDKDQLSTSLAYGEAASQVAFTLGPFLGGAAADLFGLDVPFYFIAGLCAFGAVLTLGAFPEGQRPGPEVEHKSNVEEQPAEAGASAFCWRAWGALGVSLVLSSVRFLMNPFIPFLLLRQYACSTSMLGGTLSLLSTFIFLCQVFVVKPLQRSMGIKQTCAAGIISKAVALLLWGAFPALIAPALILYAFGLALAFASLPGVVVDTAPETRRGRFLVLEASVSSFARIASPLAISMLHREGSFTTLAILLTLSSALLL